MGFRISVFISHSWNYSGHYEKLSSWIFEESWRDEGTNSQIVFVDKSIPKSDPIHNPQSSAALKNAIWSRIIASDVVVIPTGMYANYSNWIGKEIEGSKEYSKPILAVNPWDQDRTSSIVSEAAEETVGWNKKTVFSGIFELYRKRYYP